MSHSKSLSYTELRAYSVAGNVGQAIIFNNENFDEAKHGQRLGTEKDKKALKRILKELGFTVEECDDYTQVKAIQKIEEISKRDFTNDSCFMMVFLSHGKQDQVLMKKGQLYIQDDILKKFRGNKCSSLCGKPKIFLFQTCRGAKREEVACDSVFFDADVELVAEEATSQITPAGADFLVCYSSSNGYKSYRNSEDGSWFIQTTVQVLDHCLKHPDPSHDFLSLMTLVADNVAAKRHIDNSENNFLQIPSVASTLKKKLCFLKLCSPVTSLPEVKTNFDDDDGDDDVRDKAAQQSQNALTVEVKVQIT